MKLSDVRGKRTLDVIADLIDPVANIAQDKEAVDLFKRQEAPKGMDAREFFAKRAKKHAPKLLKNHKDDIIKILSTIEGTDPEEYAESLNLAKIIKDLAELVTDEEFVSFLLQAQTETGEDASESA